MPKNRKARRSAQRESYLQGKARRPYSRTPDLDRSLTEASGSSGAASGVCTRCTPILSRYVEVFQGLVHQGTQLRKRKHVNPYPKRTNAIPYRDFERQNEWLVANVFDSGELPLLPTLHCCSLWNLQAKIGTSTECQAGNVSASCG